MSLATAVRATVRLGHLYSVRRFLPGGQGGLKVMGVRGCGSGRGTMAAATDTSPLRILLLDTETNGLPKNRYAPISESGVWPAILQLSWTEATITGRTMKIGSSRDIGVALHPSIPWDADAAKIHGIAEREARQGLGADEALRALGVALRETDVVVAHNLAFDKPVIRAAAYAEWVRGGGSDLREIWPRSVREFCSMTNTRDLVRIPSPYYGPPGSGNPVGKFKAPRLNELYAWLYGHVYDISGAVLHTSRSDTHCLAQCMSGLLRRGLLTFGADRSIGIITLAASSETSASSPVSS